MSNRMSSVGSLVVTAAVLVGLPLTLPAQNLSETVQVAIPVNVSITDNVSQVIVTGRFAEQSQVQCAPGFEFQHSSVIVDPGGGRGTQRSEIVIFRSSQEPSRNGTRIRIMNNSGGGAPCNADYSLYWGVVE